MSKFNRDLKNIIQILIRNNVPAIYPAEIAHLLHCKIELVDNVLFRMVEEELLEHRYELHCCQCGEIMSVFEAPQLLEMASFPCPVCYTQTDSITMNELVSAFYPQKQVAAL
ncbi:MAG: hypothetical protein M0Z35_19845 [Desulfitobacterium hafniense]|nr:hypothetical protein [Desulfitobacterium hafniense]